MGCCWWWEKYGPPLCPQRIPIAVPKLIFREYSPPLHSESKGSSSFLDPCVEVAAKEWRHTALTHTLLDHYTHPHNISSLEFLSVLFCCDAVGTTTTSTQDIFIWERASLSLKDRKKFAFSRALTSSMIRSEETFRGACASRQLRSFVRSFLPSASQWQSSLFVGNRERVPFCFP